MLISDFIDNNRFHYEKYLAYILKANTFKSLYNYDEPFKTLDSAFVEGLESNHKEEVIATITAERSFAYFDIQQYNKFSELMDKLTATNFKNLEPGNVAYVIMQQGYIDFLNKNYKSAELKFEQSLQIIKKYKPENLPVIYGKKIELYRITKNNGKSLESFQLGLQSDKKSKLIKY